MDPITQLQTRVEWVVTAVIDTVQLISGDTAPDPDKITAITAYVKRQMEAMEADIDRIPAWQASSEAFEARVAQLQEEAAALDEEIKALLPAAESGLVSARKQLDAVSTRAFEAHIADQSK